MQLSPLLIPYVSTKWILRPICLVLAIAQIGSPAVIAAPPSATVPANAVKLVVLTPGLVLRDLPAAQFYPPDLYLSGLSGDVTVSIERDRGEDIKMAQVTHSTDRRLEVAAVKAALKVQVKKGPRRAEVRFEFRSPMTASETPVQSPPAADNLQRAPDAPHFTGDYITVKQADKKPVLTKPVQPDYPPEYFKKGIPGFADVAFIIDERGMPTQIHVTRATNKEFAESAARAVAKWRFKPALKEGRPAACVVYQNIGYSPE